MSETKEMELRILAPGGRPLGRTAVMQIRSKWLLRYLMWLPTSSKKKIVVFKEHLDIEPELKDVLRIAESARKAGYLPGWFYVSGGRRKVAPAELIESFSANKERRRHFIYQTALWLELMKIAADNEQETRKEEHDG